MQSPDEYRSAYCRLLDDADFQALSPEAQRLWFFLRFSFECGPTGLFRWYPELTRARMRASDADVNAWLTELVKAEWVRRERGFILIRNALRFEPTFKPATNRKHLAAVHRLLASLGHLRIARELLDGLALPYPTEWDSIGYPTTAEDRVSIPPRCTETEPEPETEPETEPEPEPEPEPETVAVGTTAAAVENSGAESESDDEDADQDGAPPEAVSNPDANGNPWDPIDEERFGTPPQTHARWQDYVEVNMARRTPAPWPGFLAWLSDDIKRRKAADKPPKALRGAA